MYFIESGLEDATDVGFFEVREDAAPDGVAIDAVVDVPVEIERTPDHCGNGVDDNGNGRIDESCACVLGETQACWPGELFMRNVGACRDGIQGCEGAGEFFSWGSCEGYVLASDEILGNEIDDDCDRMTDCDDPDVSDLPQCQCSPEVCSDGMDNDCDGLIDCDDSNCDADPACYCNAGGSWTIQDLWYACPSDGLCSNPGLGGGCHDTWSTGGSFSARCAGRYSLCASVVSNNSGCSVVEECLSVTIPTDGATVGLSPLPGWNRTNACAVETAWGGDAGGGRTCVRVTGTTYEGVAVDRDGGCFAGFLACNDPDGGGDGDYGSEGNGTW